jgi:hypothetical protein
MLVQTNKNGENENIKLPAFSGSQRFLQILWTHPTKVNVPKQPLRKNFKPFHRDFSGLFIATMHTLN